jgi:hypothetical protein
MPRSMTLLPRDLKAMQAKQAELLAQVRSRFPDYSQAPDEVVVELLGGEDDKFYRTLSGIIARYRA